MAISIIVHGGAWEIPDRLVEAHIGGCSAAAEVGYRVLEGGGSALEAVERAVVVLEDDPVFDAGTGSFLNRDGIVELDAGLMDGATLRSASVGAITGVRNPIRLCRRMLESDADRLVVGEGARELARELGIEVGDPRDLETEQMRAFWESWGRKSPHAIFDPHPQGTVGAVARDANGTVCAATSTGGLPNKHPGRIGDSPIVHCGFYADSAAGGASSTGDGEAIMAVGLARMAVERMRAGEAPDAAATGALSLLADPRVQGVGGLILIDRDGHVGFGFTTSRMARAWVDESGRVRAAVDRTER